MEWAASRIPTALSSQSSSTAPASSTVADTRLPSPLHDAKPGLTVELLSIAKALERVEQQRQQILHRSKNQSLVSLTTATTTTTTTSPESSSPKRVSAVAERAAVRQQHADPRFPQDVWLCECGEELHPSDRKLHLATECVLREVQCTRPGCSVRFQACGRLQHERTACLAARHTRKLLQAKDDGDMLVQCEWCHDERVPIRRRDLARHQLAQCVKRVVACRFAEWGCTERFPSDERAQHEARVCVVAKRREQIAADALCVNEEVTCDWCAGRVKKRQLLDHQEDECPARERPCPNASSGCTEWVPVGDVDAHLRSACSVTLERNALAARARAKNAMVTCRECGASVTQRRLGRHWRDECVSRIVSCKNATHGCRARLRWRDRHLHEDFATLARDRSVLQFPTGGASCIALPSVSDATTGSSVTDLAPPWTAEYYVWLVEARGEILALVRTCVLQLVVQVERAREHERWRLQAEACKRKLKVLKQQRKPQAAVTGGSSKAPTKLTGTELSAAVRDLADDFNAAETGMLVALKARNLARGWIQVLLAEALRLLRTAQQQQELDDHALGELSAAIAAQTAELLQAAPVLTELVPAPELSMLSDLERWAANTAASASSSNQADSVERQQALATQKKLLKKRAEWQDQISVLDTGSNEAPSAAETERLRRRYERELAKVDAKLAAVSENTPLELLERRGRHVIASSAKNAIALVGGSTGVVTFYRSALPSSSKTAREVHLDCALQRGRWHHVVLSAGARELRLVVDGALQSTKRGVFELPLSYIGAPSPSPVAPATTTGAQAGGDGAPAASSFQGYVQEVRYWRECRSPKQLAQYAHAVLPVAKCGARLLGYWTFEEGMGGLVDDMALALPRAACTHTSWVSYDSPAVRRRLGAPPTPSLRDQTSCRVNQTLKALAQRARDRELDIVSCRQHCGEMLTLPQLDAHQRLACRHRMVACREVGCRQLYRFVDEPQHRSEQCAPRLYRNALVARHGEKEVVVSCALQCGAAVKTRDSERHYHSECPNRLVTCPRRDCGETIVAHTVAAHVERDCSSEELARERRMVANARKRQQDKLQRAMALRGGSSEVSLLSSTAPTPAQVAAAPMAMAASERPDPRRE